MSGTSDLTRSAALLEEMKESEGCSDEWKEWITFAIASMRDLYLDWAIGTTAQWNEEVLKAKAELLPSIRTTHVDIDFVWDGEPFKSEYNAKITTTNQPAQVSLEEFHEWVKDFLNLYVMRRMRT